ncbi:MAG: glycoside hydrolase family 9 protein [candidate division KSB1 bacterium]|nr:glycoside hydrolase family 9 protein [candidate division KSB1 bacterium]
MKTRFLILLLLAVAQTLSAADLVRIEPITDRILCLTFDEGHIDYFSIGQTRYNGNKLYYTRLNVPAATNPANYRISSADDAAFASPVQPVAVGRKAKGAEFHNIYDTANPGALLLHWIYLELPQPLKEGATYTVTLEAASNVKSYRYKYDYRRLRSPAVHVNQIGFDPAAKKFAYLSHFMGDFDHAPHLKGALDLSDFKGSPFHVVDAETGEIVFTGTIALQKSKNSAEVTRNGGFTHTNLTRADVYECDFSAFTRPGRYKIAVPRMGCSYPFEIGEDLYREPFHATARAMFYQRAGIIQEIEPGFNYPRDHHPDDGVKMYWFPDLSGEGDFDVKKAKGQVSGVWGWYHDAGDWDGYLVHFRVPMTLLALYDLKPQNFGDGDIGQTYKLSDSGEWIREGENGLPDILDEAMWLIRFYKRAKERLIAHGYSDGGVPDYVGVDAGADIPSWHDKRDLALKGGKMVEATYYYAATAAYLAVCLNKFAGGEHPESAMWIAEAEAAYAWSLAKNRDADPEVNRAKEMAAAALFRATGDGRYQNDFRTCVNRDGEFGVGSLWQQIANWHYAAGLFSLIPDNFSGLDLQLKRRCINALVSRADAEYVQTAGQRGFRYGFDPNIYFGIGVFSTPKIFLAAFAYELTGQVKYLDVCRFTCDYTLGGNQMDLVKITGVGDNPEPHCFHPDSWFLIDYNDMVYANPPLPGYVLYEMHKNGDWMTGSQGNIGNGWSWVGDEDYSRSTAYPHIDQFPDAEARFFNRNSIAGSEWTVHQSLCQAIFAYGYLCGPYRQPYSPKRPPVVRLNMAEGTEVPLNGRLRLTAEASPEVERVEYYYQWHFLGESTDKENQYAFDWDLNNYKLKTGTVTITVKAFDRDGRMSRPDENVRRKIKIVAASSVDEPQGSLPTEFRLGQNYPNPFNSCTIIPFATPTTANVQVRIHNLSGELICTLINDRLNPGSYTAVWDGEDQDGSPVATGLYLYRLVTEQSSLTQKCILIR